MVRMHMHATDAASMLSASGTLPALGIITHRAKMAVYLHACWVRLVLAAGDAFVS